MGNLRDKASYLRGLAEGLEIGSGGNEGKLIGQTIDLLWETVKELDELRDSFDELNDYVESIDDDLSELEGGFEDEDDEESEADEDGEAYDEEDEDDEAPDLFPSPDDEDAAGMYLGCICAKCGGMFCVDAHEDEGNQMYVCPHCGETVEARPLDNDNVPIAKAFSEDPDDE